MSDTSRFSPKPKQPTSAERTLIYLGEARHQALKKLKERTGVPVAELIRQMIDHCLAQMDE